MTGRTRTEAHEHDGKSAFRAALKSGFVFLDGSMGALLQSRRAEAGDDWKTPEALNLTKPDLIREIHAQYLDAGANVILTNTFGGCRVKLAEYGLDPAETVAAAVRVAREAASGRPSSPLTSDRRESSSSRWEVSPSTRHTKPSRKWRARAKPPEPTSR